MSLIWDWDVFFSPPFYLGREGWFFDWVCSDRPVKIIICAHVALCVFGTFPAWNLVMFKPSLFSLRIFLKADCFLLLICKPSVGKEQYPFRAVVKRGWCLTNEWAVHHCCAKLLRKCIVEGERQGLTSSRQFGFTLSSCWPQYLFLS